MLGYLKGGSATRAIALEALGFVQQLPADIVTDLSGNSAVLYSESQIKRCAPVPRPGKIICIGLNYRDHAIESNMPIPQEPVLFPKYSNTVIGPGDTIILPPDSESPDYEAELGFTIGKEAHNAPGARAPRLAPHLPGNHHAEPAKAREPWPPLGTAARNGGRTPLEAATPAGGARAPLGETSDALEPVFGRHTYVGSAENTSVRFPSPLAGEGAPQGRMRGRTDSSLHDKTTQSSSSRTTPHEA